MEESSSSTRTAFRRALEEISAERDFAAGGKPGAFEAMEAPVVPGAERATIGASAVDKANESPSCFQLPSMIRPASPARRAGARGALEKPVDGQREQWIRIVIGHASSPMGSSRHGANGSPCSPGVRGSDSRPGREPASSRGRGSIRDHTSPSGPRGRRRSSQAPQVLTDYAPGTLHQGVYRLPDRSSTPLPPPQMII